MPRSQTRNSSDKMLLRAQLLVFQIRLACLPPGQLVDSGHSKVETSRVVALLTHASKEAGMRRPLFCLKTKQIGTKSYKMCPKRSNRSARFRSWEPRSMRWNCQKQHMELSQIAAFWTSEQGQAAPWLEHTVVIPPKSINWRKSDWLVRSKVGTTISSRYLSTTQRCTHLCVCHLSRSEIAIFSHLYE